MKPFTRLLIPMLLLAALVGCSRGRGEQSGASDEQVQSEPGVTFNAKHGLHVPPETARFIDLKLVEVEERAVTSDFRFSAQVYRGVAVAQPASLASADLSPEDARLLKQGQRVAIQLDDGSSAAGHVVEILAHTEKSSAHVDVTIAIEDSGAQPGSFVVVKVPVGGGKEVVSVPRAALLKTAEGRFVYTASGEHFVRTPVKVGVMGDEHIEIADGLYPGDKVVVNPVMSLWMAELQSIRGGKACADGH